MDVRRLLDEVEEPTTVEALGRVGLAGEAVVSVQRSVESSLLSRLRRCAGELEVGVAALCHLAWGQVLERISGQKEVIFGTDLGARGKDCAVQHAGLRALPLRLRIADQGARDGVLACHRALEQLRSQLAPLPEVIQRQRSAFPLFRSALSYVEVGQEQTGGADSRSLAGAQPEGCAITLAVVETQTALELAARVFEPADASRVCTFLHRALEVLVGALEQDDDRPLSELCVLPGAERERLVLEWNATEAIYPHESCVHQLFEARAAACPDAVAVVEGERSMTYRGLDREAARWCSYLVGAGIGPGQRVAIVLPRSIELVTLQLAVLECGAAYVPLDSGTPAQRLAWQIEDCQAALILTASPVELPAALSAKAIWIDRLNAEALAGAASAEHSASAATRPKVTSEAPAYVMYTSGSTGQPKGALVPHRAIVKLVVNNGFARFNASDRVAFVASPAFDPSTLEVWAPLLHGGCIVILDQPTVLDPARLQAALEAREVTVLNLTSAVFNQFAEALMPAFARLRYLLLGGDRADPRALRRVLQSAAPQHLVYTYGPTETTLFATAQELVADSDWAGTVPIGRPIANTRVYILDEHGRVAAIGQAGELHVGGAGVALGYVGRPELTKERFVPDRFSQGPGARLYRTGDLARWNSEGLIEFLGRNDLQLKIRGFRVEPGEIEAALRQHPGVKEAVVIARSGSGGEKQLIAYYTRTDGLDHADLSARELRGHLAAILPEYMLPAAYVSLARLPLTAQGKVDRSALPAPDASALVVRDYDKPRSGAEQVLARLWAELLDVSGTIGRNDNFFELGGDSIRVIKLIWKLRALGLELQPSQVVERPTLAELAACLGQLQQVKAEQEALLGGLPLTPIQHKFFASRPPQIDHHNQAYVFELSASFELAGLRTMFGLLESQHDMLRARFQRDEQGWHAEYGPVTAQPSLEAIDARGIAQEQESEWLNVAATDVQRALSIERGPVYQARLIHFERGDVLLVVIHHLVIDGVSWRVFIDDLNRLLTQHALGQTFDLGAKTSSYRQWAKGLIAYANGPEILRELSDHWRSPALLDACAAPPGLGAPMGAPLRSRVTCQLSREQTAELFNDAPRMLKARTNDLLLTALGLALQGTFGPHRWRIQLEGHGREQELVPGADVSRTLGWFTSEFPLVIDVEGASLDAVLERVKSHLSAVPHKGVGYSALLYLRGTLAEADRAHLRRLDSQVAFNYLGQTGHDLSHEMIRLSSLPAGTAVAATNQRALLLDIMGHVDGSGALQFSFDHCGSRARVEELAEAYRRCLLQLTAHCRSKAAAARSGLASASVRTAVPMLARPARPDDYAGVVAVCEATLPNASRWVAERVAAGTWIDPLWASAGAAKFVLEAEGRIVGYLIGALDIDEFDTRGLLGTSLRAPLILGRGVVDWARGFVSGAELLELTRHLKRYVQYTLGRLHTRRHAGRAGATPARNVMFHFNVQREYESSGGMLSLIELWEQWLHARGEPYAFLHVGSFQGLGGSRELASELARGIGYARRPELHPSYWTKELCRQAGTLASAPAAIASGTRASGGRAHSRGAAASAGSS